MCLVTGELKPIEGRNYSLMNAKKHVKGDKIGTNVSKGAEMLPKNVNFPQTSQGELSSASVAWRHSASPLFWWFNNSCKQQTVPNTCKHYRIILFANNSRQYYLRVIPNNINCKQYGIIFSTNNIEYYYSQTILNNIIRKQYWIILFANSNE